MVDILAMFTDLGTTIFGGLAVIVLYAMFRRFKRFVESVDKVHMQLNTLILVLIETIPGFEAAWNRHNRKSN